MRPQSRPPFSPDARAIARRPQHRQCKACPKATLHVVFLFFCVLPLVTYSRIFLLCLCLFLKLQATRLQSARGQSRPNLLEGLLLCRPCRRLQDFLCVSLLSHATEWHPQASQHLQPCSTHAIIHTGMIRLPSFRRKSRAATLVFLFSIHSCHSTPQSLVIYNRTWQ